MTKANNYLRLAEGDGARSSCVMSADLCHTAADVRVQAAHVRAFRTQVWPSQRPAAPPAPSPMPGTPVLVLALPELPAVPGRISVRRVVEVTAGHFGTTVPDLISHCRKQPLTRRRQIAMYVARKVTGRGLPFIGHKLDRHHTTVLHGVRVVKGLLDAGDGETIAAVNQIVEQLQVTGGAHDGR
jgi:hypothetical protein